MSFRIPRTPYGKTIASANNDFLIPVTFSETNVERMLTQILERVIKQGKASAPHTNSSFKLEFPDLVDKLSKSEEMSGFDNNVGREILAGWLKSSIVEMIPVGKGKKTEQIDYLRPLTAASYRSGLPRQRSRHRRADVLVYESLKRAYKNASGNTDDANLSADFIESSSIGKGVNFLLHPHTNPEYDGETQIDIESLLELRFIEGIPGKDPGPVRQSSLKGKADFDSPLPNATYPMGEDLFNYVSQYSDKSSNELISSMACILALRLFQMPIVAARDLNRLLFQPVTLESGLDKRANCCELYFDFTLEPGGASEKLAKQAVQRDLQLLADFFPNVILLREAENCLKANRELATQFELLSSEEKLKMIIASIESLEVGTAASIYVNSIEQDVRRSGSEENLAEFEKIKLRIGNDLRVLVELILEDRRNDGHAGLRKWSYSTGGLVSDGSRRPYALLSGTMKAPTTWKYQMTEPMLLTLIDLCFLGDDGVLSNSNSMPLALLLERLNQRFGVLIDKAPLGLASPENNVAAAQNLGAFTRRLKLLGYFEGLSDDFSAQYITRPSR